MTYDERAKIYTDTENLKWLLGKWTDFMYELRYFLETAEAPPEMAEILSDLYKRVCGHCEKMRNAIKTGTEKIKYDFPDDIKIDSDEFEKIYNQRYEVVDDTPFMPVECVYYP